MRQTVALTNQIQIRLAGFEENLDLPPLSIDSDDIFLRKIRIGADKGNPVFLVLLVSDTNDFGWNLPCFADEDIDGKKIFAATSAFFTDSEDFLERQHFSLVFIVNPTTLSDHCDGIKSKVFDRQ